MFCLTMSLGVVGMEKSIAQSIAKKGEEAQARLTGIAEKTHMLWSKDELYVVDTWKNPCYSKNPTPDPKVVHLTYMHTNSLHQETTLSPAVFNTWIAQDRELYIYGVTKLKNDYLNAGYNFCSGLKIYIMSSLKESMSRKVLLGAGEIHKIEKASLDAFMYLFTAPMWGPREDVYQQLQALANVYNTKMSADKNNPSFKKVELYLEEDIK
jgi:hypothetical protein